MKLAATALLTGLFFSASASAGVIIHDDFGDGSLGTNPGTGSGFVSNGQDPASESGGNAVLNATNTSATVQIESIDTFDAFQTLKTRSTWSISNVTQGFNEYRSYVGLQDANSAYPFFLPITGGAQGLYISIFQYTADTAMPGTVTGEGNLFALSDTGVQTHLAEWDWNSFSDSSPGSSGALDIILETDSTGYNLSFSQGISLQSGSLTGDLTSLGVLSNSFNAAAFNQWPGNTMEVDSITVETIEVPAPGAWLLFGLGLLGLAKLRRRGGLS